MLTGIISDFVGGGLALVGLKWVVVRLERRQKQGYSIWKFNPFRRY